MCVDGMCTSAKMCVHVCERTADMQRGQHSGWKGKPAGRSQRRAVHLVAEAGPVRLVMGGSGRGAGPWERAAGLCKPFSAQVGRE